MFMVHDDDIRAWVGGWVGMGDNNGCVWADVGVSVSGWVYLFL